MPRFFTDPINGQGALLTGEDARHVTKALRMREGEALTLCDGRGFDYRCEITSLGLDEVILRVTQKTPNISEPKVKLHLYQALPKGDKLDLIVQKAVELGVYDITPVLTSRCISRPEGRSMEKKRGRMQKVAVEAAKQSGRGIIPQIRPLLHFEDAISGMKEADTAILLYERAEEPLSRLLSALPRSAALMAGAEGGFSGNEAEYARDAGVAWASLGGRILRCETAPLCALSAILYACGEF